MVNEEEWHGKGTRKALITKIDNELTSVSDQLSTTKLATKQAKARSKAASLLWEIQRIGRKQNLHEGYLSWVEHVLRLLLKNTGIKSVQASLGKLMKRKLEDTSYEDASTMVRPQRLIKKARTVLLGRAEVGENSGKDDCWLRRGTSSSSKGCKRRLPSREIALEINAEARLSDPILSELEEPVQLLRKSSRIRRPPERFGFP